MAGKKRPVPKRISETRPAPLRARPEGNGSAAGGAAPPTNGEAPPVRRTDASRRAVTQVTRTGAPPARGSAATRAGSRPAPAGRAPGGGGKAGARQSGRVVEASKRRISPAMWGWGGGTIVFVAVIVIALFAVLNKPTNSSSGHVGVPASIVHTVTNVPASVLDSVGIGGNKIDTKSSVGNPVDVIKGPYKAGNGLAAVDGKPDVFYFGALYCPFCATERWPLIVALSRFGTFKDLAGAVSSSTDVYPSTQTWSFDGASYSSPYISFTPVEAEGEQQQPLEPLTAAETKVLKTWDPVESFPFITIGNKYTAYLPSWLDPEWLHNLSRAEISQTLAEGNRGNQAGNGIDADANYLTAAICSVDGQQPSTVCSSKGVMAAAAQLKSAPAAKPLTQ